MNRKQFDLHLDEQQGLRVEQAARRLGKSADQLVQEALDAYVLGLAREFESEGASVPPASLPRTHSAAGAAAGSERTDAHQPFPPFQPLAEQVQPQTPLRCAITSAYRRSEPESIAALLDDARLDAAQAQAAHTVAVRLAERLRSRKAGVGREGLVQGLIQEFSLSSQEGVALMCLAEALLRIPDARTRDALIRDKIGGANWKSHLGGSASVFVNAATWGLLVTGKLVTTHHEGGLGGALTQIIGRGGEPLIRKAVDMMMGLMGEQFVTGETIAEALANARRRELDGFRFSYDMLGEAALTEADAQRYFGSYRDAIDAIGKASAGRGIYDGPGISIKLSALHPRYSRAQIGRVMDELYPRLLNLTLLARHHDIGLNIDAEEADRLELSLDLVERLCFEPALAGWNGIGFVVQAYQKRCPYVLDYLIDLARRSRRRLMVRLVKGAYWDSEIKRAQVDGLEGYPVYTRKAYTDVSYLACARKLLAAPAAIYPQFATHNAHTVAAIDQLAGQNYYAGQYEFQCLHGMGEPLYEQVVAAKVAGGLGRPCRVYAPVGNHETLLAYLVRRLLENGANTSFVNRIADPAIPIDELVAHPVDIVERMAQEDGARGLPHPLIALPRDLYGLERKNSAGIDLSNEHHLATLCGTLLDTVHGTWSAAPLIGSAERHDGTSIPVLNPADRRDVVGQVFEATARDVAEAMAMAEQSLPAWRVLPAGQRAAILERAADLFETEMRILIGLIVREAGKTYANAIGEVREAVDFLRYYAAQARSELQDGQYQARGPIVCISPWNFPLAIFIGQVAAALAAGNTVLAKPAEQTALIAAQAVRLLAAAGLPPGILQLLPGRGEVVGAALVADLRVRGVVFTGSTEVARLLQRSLAGRLDELGRPLPLIAETGGQNAMIVDSSALLEQVVGDVMTSAFDSAGQRCSALRVLCLQEEIADRALEMLKGAMHELRVGRPDRLSTDLGPVIDIEARQAIDAHIAKFRAQGRHIYQSPVDEADCAWGSFVAPTLIELERIAELDKEVFGPVLHVVRYRREEMLELIEQINATGYGLTLGIHTRINETIDFVVSRAHVGNQYVNRNMVGAVVGVQPFGGEGLSGTGPKAGGPLYLRRLLATSPPLAIPQQEGNPRSAALDPLRSLRDWLAARGGNDALLSLPETLAHLSPVGFAQTMPGPTGERNSYSLVPREAVLCLADDEEDLLYQLAHVLAAGARAVWLNTPPATRLHLELPEDLRLRIELMDDAALSRIDAALIQAEPQRVTEWSQRLADRPGPIVGLQACAKGASITAGFSLEPLMSERAISVNTAAAGGNASLMTIG